MNDHFDLAFGAIAGAISARRLYGPDHRGSVESARRAHAEVARALEGAPYVEYHLLGDRVVGPEGVVACDAGSADTIRVALEGRGAASMRFERGVTEADMVAFLASLEGGPGVESGATGRIALGHAMIATAGASQDGPPTAMRIASAFREATLIATPEAPIDPNRLEDIAGSICAALMCARGTMIRLASLKSHDEYTFMHTVNVALLAASLADACGLSPDQVHQITLAALMHDLGKRGIPVSILGKDGPLDAEERRVMQTHPVEGARLLAGRPGVPDVAAIVAYEHHMHLDGTGYPDRLRGNRPHLASQIVQQADVYDALRTHRPYRAALTENEACALLFTGTGSRYDTPLVETFIERVASRVDAPPSAIEPGDPTRAAA